MRRGATTLVQCATCPHRSDPQLPRGVGMYLRKITREAYGTPAQAAARAADHGLSFVAFPSVWQDERGHLDLNASRLEEEYAAAMRERRIAVWVWGYPDLGREGPFVRDLVEHARRLRAAGVLPDVEKPYKGEPAATRRLLELVIDSLDEGLGLGVTSYGRLDWHELEALEAYGWISPQVYTVTAEAARRAILSWLTDEHGRVREGVHVVPSIPTYGPNSEGQLGAYLGAIEDLCAGAIAWSWPSTSALEWRTLERWAARFELAA